MCNDRERVEAIKTAKRRYLACRSYTQIADELGVTPTDIWRAVNQDYASPALVKAMDIKITRTRFTADIPQHLKDDIQAKRYELGLKTNGEFLEYLWLFWKHFHDDINGGIKAEYCRMLADGAGG